MPAPMENSGLCVTCNQSGVCIYRKKTREPVSCCEEFDGPAMNAPVVLLNQNSKNQRIEPDSGGYTGLCVDCEGRGSCISSKSPGGVWHCEEYA